MMLDEIAKLLDGVAGVLAESVTPQVADPYATNVLQATVGTISQLAVGVREAVAFMAWDSSATAALLRSCGLDVRESVESLAPFDIDGLTQCHRALRAALERAIERGDLDDRIADVAAHFRERAARHPLRSRAPGVPSAQPSR